MDTSKVLRFYGPPCTYLLCNARLDTTRLYFIYAKYMQVILWLETQNTFEYYC